MLAIASPVTIPNEFSDGGVISAPEFNDNFDAIATAINDNDTRLSAVEAPTITVRKATGTASRSVAIAYCEADEILLSGGCFIPPENRYDVYFTGNFPRAMVGMTSVPVAAGTADADIRPVATTGSDIIPFPGDIVAEDAGSVAAGLGGGWACRPGTVDLDNANGAQALTTNIYEGWFFFVKAYAVCMQVSTGA
jgi:hypothetical protein